jgi:Flp pilus assembly protein TadG
MAGTEGAAVVEFTLFAPILLGMVVFTMDLGFGMYRYMQVQHAAQAGIQYAIVHGYNSSSISSAVTDATAFAGISASPAPSQFCGCRSNTGVTSAACNSTCADGSAAGTYVTVSSQGTYNTIAPYPGIPNSFNLTAQGTVRIQ